MKSQIKKFIDYIFEKIHKQKIELILKKYKIDTDSYEKGRQFGYEKGFIDGTKSNPQKHYSVPKKDYDDLIIYLASHNLVLIYNVDSPDGTGLMVRKI